MRLRVVWFAIDNGQILTFPPALGHAGGIFGLDQNLRQVDVLMEVALGDFEAVFQLGDALFEQDARGLRARRAAACGGLRGNRAGAGVPRRGTWDRARGWPGRSFPLFRRRAPETWGRSRGSTAGVRGRIARTSHEDQIGKIDVAEPGAAG